MTASVAKVRQAVEGVVAAFDWLDDEPAPPAPVAKAKPVFLFKRPNAVDIAKGETTMRKPDTRTLRELAWAGIEAAADTLLAKSSSPMTSAQAITTAAMSPEGQRLYALYKDADAHLTVDVWLAKRAQSAKLAALGYVDWSHAVAKLAHDLGDGDDERGLREVQKRAPDAFAAYLQESRGWR